MTEDRLKQIEENLADESDAGCPECGVKVSSAMATELVTEVRRLRDALGLYAEPAFWDFGKAKPEGGFLARAALASQKPG
jgi:hypothetical protein